jgi:hypothetical protein
VMGECVASASPNETAGFRKLEAQLGRFFSIWVYTK